MRSVCSKPMLSCRRAPFECRLEPPAEFVLGGPGLLVGPGLGLPDGGLRGLGLDLVDGRGRLVGFGHDAASSSSSTISASTTSSSAGALASASASRLSWAAAS